MNDLSTGFEYELILLTRHLTQLQRHASSGLAPLDRSAFTLLSRIERGGPMSIGQLRDAIGLDDSTLNRQTAAAVRAGYIERIRDPEGGVAKKFALTDSGRGRLAKEYEAIHRVLRPVVASWSDERVAALSHEIRSFNESLEALEGRSWPHA